jgi:hypothetical protein
MPQPAGGTTARGRTTMSRFFLISCAAAIAIAAGGARAQASDAYAAELSRVYEAAQFVQAVKEGCDSAEPDSRAPNEAAYGAWRKRHQPLLDELERRFIAMIRRASANQQEYSKNVGKYAGEVLQHLEDMKKQFLAQGTQEVARQCREFPQYLKGPDADLRKRYAAELKSIRKRKI